MATGGWRTKQSEKLRPGLVGRSKMTSGYVDQADVMGRSKRTRRPKVDESIPKRRRRRH